MWYLVLGLCALWLFSLVLVIAALRVQGAKCRIIRQASGVWFVMALLALLIYAVLGAAPALQKTWVLQSRVQWVKQQWASDGGSGVVARMQAYVKAHPEAADAWYWLARLQWRRGQSQKAREALKRAMLINPESVRYKHLAKILNLELPTQPR